MNVNMERENLKPKYEAFLKTAKGQEWKREWIARTGLEEDGDFEIISMISIRNCFGNTGWFIGKERTDLCNRRHGMPILDGSAWKISQNRKKWTRNDYMVICGDFGLLWDKEESKREKWWLDWLAEKSYTTLVVDGNHGRFHAP